MNNLCYVYLHINPITYEPFYIGKGGGLTKRKESRTFSIQNRNKHWTNIVNKYKKIGMANKGKIRSDKVKQNLIIRQFLYSKLVNIF